MCGVGCKLCVGMYPSFINSGQSGYTTTSSEHHPQEETPPPPPPPPGDPPVYGLAVQPPALYSSVDMSKKPKNMQVRLSITDTRGL